MIKSLDAFLKKLTWQHNELSQARSAIEYHLSDIEHTINACQLNLYPSRPTTGAILPEQEIAHGYFLQQKQLEWTQLQQNKNDLLAQKDNIDQQHHRLKIDLKRLKKQMETKIKNKAHQALMTEFNNMDEWIIQRSQFE